ncbi:hypothetical protein GYMLUDRAFT_87392 [Collybiopsis luxurians FD-317 M1]|uniref:Uncharacterized protein n=1 Tax=Collybiopsis luxurians FD-317 M1 TaxID=944289 RepID=A0A0D0BMJ8_9AGAR|nr:hypothetical protein GYMLUDRAFT_87392 [Collybiopsis luxurians FD-317 M1]
MPFPNNHVGIQRALTIHPNLNIEPVPAEDDRPSDSGYPQLRTSLSTSLDINHSGFQSHLDSPVPPLPATGPFTSRTPDRSPLQELYTPAKDPSTIDRRGLVGISELTTSRWIRTEQTAQSIPVLSDQEVDEGNQYCAAAPGNEDDEQDEPDSPWTIEAVDGEMSDRDDSLPWPLRERPSMAEESGEEEILYPRKPSSAAPRLPDFISTETSSLASSTVFSAPVETTADPPPDSFLQPPRNAVKRSSNEFELEQTGSLVSKRAGSTSLKDRGMNRKSLTRKHRSMIVTILPSFSSSDKEQWRESTALTINSRPKLKQHRRRASLSSSSNVGDARRATVGSDFSHFLPPSLSLIQDFLKNSGAGPNTLSVSATKELRLSPSVAHSPLWGTQEAWSGMDDEATVEALRKLDGLPGKSARPRASVGSFGRPHSSSRLGTPAGSTGTGSQWEGVDSSSDGGIKRRGSSHRDNALSVKEKEPRHVVGPGLGLVSPSLDKEAMGSAYTSNDEQSVISAAVAVDKTPNKSSARSSFTPKRRSISPSTNASTSTTNSRDSVSMSAVTSMTSMSSARHAIGKARRNSPGSDVSSTHSSDVNSLKDHVASIASNSDGNEKAAVPPVPPLPKDLLTYRMPPVTAVGLTLPHLQQEKPRSSRDSNHGTLKVPPLNDGTGTSPSLSKQLSSSHQHQRTLNPNLLSILQEILHDQSSTWMQRLNASRDETLLQQLADIVQSELDTPLYSNTLISKESLSKETVNRRCFQALRSLSNAFHVLPSSLTITEIKKNGNNPVAGGGFAEILALQVPFYDRRTEGSVILCLVNGERPARPESVWCSEAIWDLITRCWAQNPAHRPNTQEVREALIRATK